MIENSYKFERFYCIVKLYSYFILPFLLICLLLSFLFMNCWACATIFLIFMLFPNVKQKIFIFLNL